ncbi:MAG TPA: hypothetical protein VHO03_20600 [Ignavibacteriales bacterium]|nr:hypothetical protein [Ignavibacteriales bacterium]
MKYIIKLPVFFNRSVHYKVFPRMDGSPVEGRENGLAVPVTATIKKSKQCGMSMQITNIFSKKFTVFLRLKRKKPVFQ